MEFKRYAKVIDVNGHNVECEIVIQVHEHDANESFELLMDQDFESEADKAAYAKRIEGSRALLRLHICRRHSTRPNWARFAQRM